MKSYCYFIQCGKSGPVKIGICDNISKRISSMQTGNPEELRLAFAIECKSRKMAEAIEQDFHKYFKSRNIRGEWFTKSVLKRAHKMHWFDLADQNIIYKVP